METVTLHTRLKLGKESEYESVHEVIPPALDALLRQHGVTSWRIYRKDRDLFHIVECENYNNLLEAISEHPINIAWQKRMGDLLEVTHDYNKPSENRLNMIWQLPG
jgi:L-rhamnose mutarotase